MPDGPDKPGSQSGAQLVERKLSTILSADVAEFSRLMGEDEEQTLRIFRGHKKVFESLVASHRGRIFNTAGDAILADFASAVEAVRCATDIQSALRTRNDQLPPSRQVRFRIGINLGDVMIQGQDLLGDGVNVAARLQTAAEPGGICISGSVHDQIRNKLSLSFQSLGERNFKNIQQPVRTFSIVEGEGGNTLPYSRPRSAWRSPAIWIGASVLLVAGGGYAAYLVHQHSKTTNPPMTASAVRPQSVPSQPLVSGPAMPVEKPATSQPRTKAALSTEGLKATSKSQNASVPAASSGPVQARRSASAHAPSARRGAFDGLYAGPVCYGKTNVLPARCYRAEGVVNGDKITGSWPMTNESGVTMFVEGEVAPTGEVIIVMHSDRADGSRQSTINLTGTIRGGLLEATGKFVKGRPATLNWRIAPDAAR